LRVENHHAPECSFRARQVSSAKRSLTLAEESLWIGLFLSGQGQRWEQTQHPDKHVRESIKELGRAIV
jgi:hypothetical protein